MANHEVQSKVAGIFSFPAYRSTEWLEQHRQMPAVKGCLENTILQPQSLVQYSHIRAYKVKAEYVRQELRNALFRQALFKVQNIEVLSLNKCKNDRILQEIIKLGQPSYLQTRLLGRSIIAEELWKVDRCGSLQSYKVRYYREGGDGFTCKVYTTTMENFLYLLRYYMSL